MSNISTDKPDFLVIAGSFNATLTTWRSGDTTVNEVYTYNHLQNVLD